DLKYCSTRKVPLLKEAHVQGRLKFANEHLNDSKEDWETGCGQMRPKWGDSGTGVEKSFNNQKVARSSIPCRSVLEQGTEPLIAPDVQCAISVKCVYIVSGTYVSRFG